MANRVIKQNELSHYNESYYDYPVSPSQITIPEVDKSKSISEMTLDELRRLIGRLRDERDAEDIIRSLRRSAGQKDTFENPAKIDTNTPIDQLYHHGIEGMKWGIRRFQKENGRRTPAGKKREAENEVAKSEDHIKSRESKNKAPAGLSNDELRKLNERLQLESTYKTLTTEKIEKAESFVEKSIKAAAGSALQTFATGVMLGAAKTLVKEISPSFADIAFNIKQPTPAAPKSTEKKEEKK